jgi:putative pyoverdin transport system ATP-binding/permease protein
MILNQSILLGSNALYVVLIVLILLLPIVAPSDDMNLARIATLIVFIFGPLGEVVGAYPQISEASASIREIYRIESRLDSIFETDATRPGQAVVEAVEPPSSVAFESIVCRQLAFKFHDEKGAPTFSLEPFDFDLKRGELVFVTGGNGSGKSTFMRVLTTLYPPEQGQILLNNELIGAHNRKEYRELFSPIFADFHLFDQLYGIDKIDKGQIASLLSLAELQHKTSIEGKKITNTQLSTGQRKRLALLVALLEDKPILLLDEWAADQDPVFRRKFYREILPDLKRSGKTIIAVSHDDEYYGVADRVLKMEFGKFVQVSMAQTPE